MRPSQRQRRRRGFQWSAVLVIVVVWNLLWGNVSVANVVSGLIVALFVIALFPLPPILFTGRVRPVGTAKLAFRFLTDLTVASAQVAWLAVRPGPPLHSAVIEVPLFSDSDLYLTLTSEFVSLVPGSVVVDVSRATSTLYVHVVDITSDEDVALARRRVLREEKRVVEALSSDSELREYREAVAEAPLEGRPL